MLARLSSGTKGPCRWNRRPDTSFSAGKKTETQPDVAATIFICLANTFAVSYWFVEGKKSRAKATHTRCFSRSGTCCSNFKKCELLTVRPFNDFETS